MDDSTTTKPIEPRVLLIKAMTTTKSIEPHVLLIKEGHDYQFEENDRLPYVLIKNLGHGHTANVKMVRDEHSSNVFARKVFRICSTRDERRSIFENEIKIIRQLAPNPHITRVFATYVAKREVGLILQPVADQGDLGCFLQDYRDAKSKRDHNFMTLVFSFACLANGLSFMHDQKILHKDIKPSNILIHQRKIIYADFGFSLDHSAAIGTTTTGRPDAITRKYCAPEVSEWEPGNSNSDIFSLGCVFFEILAAILEIPLLDRQSVYHQKTSLIRRLLTIHDCSFATLELSAYSALHKCASNFVLKMTAQEPHLRPSAQSIFKALQLENSHSYCDQCRRPPSEPFFHQPVPGSQQLVSRSMTSMKDERKRRWLGFTNTSTAARKIVLAVKNLWPSPNISPEHSNQQPVLTPGPPDTNTVISRPLFAPRARKFTTSWLDYAQTPRLSDELTLSEKWWEPGATTIFEQLPASPVLWPDGHPAYLIGEDDE